MSTNSGTTLIDRAALLATYSEEPDRLTRRVATPALKQATDQVALWMRAAGMQVRQDNLGNLIGRYEAHDSHARTLILGSHLDSVRDAGKYDGPLGVLTALACVERLHVQGVRLPFAIEVIAFADEEGLRFHTAYLGSSVVAGTFDPAYLDLIDADGITLADAISSFGGEPGSVIHDARSGDDLLGYCEVHIEQGPVLEAHGLPVGVVQAIVGQSRFALTFAGMAGHAGTVPMALRRDALCAGAECIVAVETLARSIDGLVATVGQITAEPGASNVIPGAATLSLDVRHADDMLRRAMIERLREQANEIAARREVELTWQVVQETASVPCDPGLTATLEAAIAAQGYPIERLVSGAGHDGVIMSRITSIAMLFVRCAGGISHNPAESITAADARVAVDVLGEFLQQMAREVAHERG